MTTQSKALSVETLKNHSQMPQESAGPLRVAFYARVSTEEQREGQNIDSQLKELETFAQAHQWVPVGVYRDEGWSGAMLVRPDLDRLRDDAQKKLFDVVLINDVDRLARDVAHLSVIRRDLEGKGVRVMFRKLPGDLSPTQNLMVNILGSFAEFEREMILDRTRRGIRYKIEIRKLYLGCNPAYGYRYVSKNKATDGVGRLEVHAEEAAVVRRIYDWVDKESLSARQVVARLNTLGILARSRAKWAASTMQKILRNEIYAGLWYYNKHYRCEPLIRHKNISPSKTFKSSCRLRPRTEWIAVPLPTELRLVEQDTWERVQERITKNTSWSRRNSKHNYLLRSLVRCAGCNARMVGGPHGNAFYYRCRSCKKVREIQEERLNRTVWDALCGTIRNPAIILDQAQKYYEERRRTEEKEEIQQREALTAQAQIEHEERRILEAYRQGLIESEQLGREIEILKARRNALQAGPGTSRSGNGDILPDFEHMIHEYCDRVSQVLNNMTLAQKQQLLRILIVEVVFDGKCAVIKARIPCHGADHDLAPAEDASVSPASYHREQADIATTMLTGRGLKKGSVREYFFTDSALRTFFYFTLTAQVPPTSHTHGRNLRQNSAVEPLAA